MGYIPWEAGDGKVWNRTLSAKGRSSLGGERSVPPRVAQYGDLGPYERGHNQRTEPS